MKIYLANCLGFYPLLQAALDDIVEYLQEQGFVVYEPFREYNTSEPVQGYNVERINQADVVVAIRDGSGLSLDDGVAWEMGYAHAKGKYVIMLDTRNLECSAVNQQCTPNKTVDSLEELVKSLRRIER